MELKAVLDQWWVDLWQLQQLALQSFQNGSLPDRSSVPPNVFQMACFTAALAGLVLVVLLSGRCRRLVLKTADTVIATVLLVLLLAVVIGLPFGILYLSYRGIAFVLQAAYKNLSAPSRELEGLL